MRDNTPYDAERDFSPISLLARVPAVLAVHPSLPIKSARELIVLAKARAGELNYSSGGTGGSAHLAAELFKANGRRKYSGHFLQERCNTNC